MQSPAACQYNIMVKSVDSNWYFGRRHEMKINNLPVSRPGVLCNIWYPSQTHLKNPVKSRLLIIYLSVIQSLWNFVQSTAVILSCSVQNFKTIGQLKRFLWTKEISRELSRVEFKLSFGIYFRFRTDILYCTAPLSLVVNLLVTVQANNNMSYNDLHLS